MSGRAHLQAQRWLLVVYVTVHTRARRLEVVEGVIAHDAFAEGEGIYLFRPDAVGLTDSRLVFPVLYGRAGIGRVKGVTRWDDLSRLHRL